MIEKFEVTEIKKQGRVFYVETNIGTGTGFGMLKTINPNDADNGGLVVSMGYLKKNPEVVEFVKTNGMKATIVIRKDILKKFGIEISVKDKAKLEVE
jgi:hypothetical protein